MVALPNNQKSTGFLLNNTPFERPAVIETPHDDFERSYCGMSSIGNPCIRALQYSSRRASKREIEPRVNRIFDMGHILEAYMVLQLQNIGIEVTGQQEEVVGFAGHWRGHIDGKGLNIPEAPKTEHLLEFKTHNDNQFNKLKKNGVEKSHPKHYAQMMRYMGGLELTRGLYVAFNKNDCTYHCERIYFNDRKYDELVHKEQEVLLTETLLPRIGNGKQTWYECKFCDHKNVCYGNEMPVVNCRTCQHVDMCNDGVWECGLSNDPLTYKEQMAACKMYELADMFR